jgi:hypothetical protein
VQVQSLLSGGCDGRSSPDFPFIDNYLTAWDQFAQGVNELMPVLKQARPGFDQQLALALTQKDKRAPSRLVFYAVVQVGGFIPCESELGQAWMRTVGDEFHVFTSKKGERKYFAGDLYFWWESHKAEFETFPIYDEWRMREFARKRVIPLYVSALKNR